MSLTFLVIGSNSFSGSNFISYLLKNSYKVIGVSRSNEPDSLFLPYLWGNINLSKKQSSEKNFQFYKYDLNKETKEIVALVDKFKPEYIVNFASQGMVAESWKNPLDWYKTNLISQVNLHEMLRKRLFIKKYVHVTTPEVYGSTDNGWLKESEIYSPSTPYAVSRAACDLHLKSFFKAYDFPVVFTRAANVYGPGQQLYRVIPRSFLSAHTSKKMKLHGGGISERSFIHIDDVASATLSISLNAIPGSSWHISTKKSISIRELVNKIFNLVGAPFEKYVEISEERLGKDQSYLLDSSKLRNELNWFDQINLEKGLNSTNEWIKENLDSLTKMSWEYKHKA